MILVESMQSSAPPPIPVRPFPSPCSPAARGRYRLEGRIATGAMGEVWRAHDTLLDQPVAVKMLRPEVAGLPVWRERLRREARYTGLVSHTGAARLLDFHDGADGGFPFLVMELIDAPSLGDVLRAEGRLPARHVLSLIQKTAVTLSGAHAAGVVHRDLKPDNLLLAGREVKVIDFGVAWFADDPAMTRAGTMVGTPHYMSPEQVAERPVTGASDLYSLGVIAYQCLVGSLPFTGSVLDVAIAHRDLPLPDLPPAVPAAVADFVKDLTSKDPAKRADGLVVAARAERLLTELTAAAPRAPQAPPAAERRRHKARACHPRHKF